MALMDIVQGDLIMIGVGCGALVYMSPYILSYALRKILSVIFSS